MFPYAILMWLFHVTRRAILNLSNVIVRPIEPSEERYFHELMQSYHYLGALPKIGNTILYVATVEDIWVSLLSFSAAALKNAARDLWIGWDFRHHYDRLNLVANNSRFLILPQFHKNNLASKILSLCQKRIQKDWMERFGFPLLLLETFVDSSRYQGTIYKAANWEYVGITKGYRRIRGGYSKTPTSSKMIFVQPLQRNTRAYLSRPILHERYRTGRPKMKLTAEQMRFLPGLFKEISDPRREQGLRHRIEVVLAISTAAILCGVKGYNAISIWAQSLKTKARARFGCRRKNGHYIVPSENTIRDVLIRVNPEQLDKALQKWNEIYGVNDESMAIDGKTMCNAINDDGRQIHIMSVIGHKSGQCYTQKKLAPFQ